MEKWNKITIDTTTEAVDAISYQLEELGIKGIEIIDHVPLSEEDRKTMYVDLLPDEIAPDDGTAKILCYIDDHADVESMMSDISVMLQDMSAFFNVGAATVSLSETKDEDWVNNWKKYFKPFRLDDHIIIKPTWEVLDDQKKDDIVVEIESGSEYATLGKTDYGYYYLSGNPEMTDKEGIVVLKAYSESRPEISVTKEIKVIKVKTASEIRDILLSKTYVATLSDFYNSQASLKFNDDNSGVFTLLNQHGSLFDEAHFTWVVSATGNISMADITYTNGYISEFSVAFKDPDYQKLEGSFVDEVESDDEYGSTIYFEFM